MANPDDMAAALVLDGNAVAGEMEELLGSDMTAALHRCANCGNLGALATLRAYTGGPGTVLRCSICREVVIRLVRTPTATYLDLRGAAYVSMAAPGSESR
jgi:hypothetical protein